MPYSPLAADLFPATDPDAAVWMALRHLTIVEVTGADAEAFLQGQFSNDLNALQNGGCQLHAYCNPKGRVLALPRVLRTDAGLTLLVESGVAPDFIKRLRMFVLRAKVQFTMDEHRVAVGLLNTPTPPLPVPLFRLNSERGLCLLPEAALAEWPGAREASENLWRLTDIIDGIPQLYPATREQFIPQNINLDLVDGVNFRKGCYPGQEIVARVKYRGRAKQRMIAGYAATAAAQPADALYVQGEPGRKVGNIVDAVTLAPDKTCFSAVVPWPLADRLALHTGIAVEPVDLPYAISD